MAGSSRIKLKTVLGVALAALMVMLIAWCVFLVRDKLLLNADRMGSSLAATYAAEEESRFSVYRHFLRLGSVYIDDMVKEGDSEKDIATWLKTLSGNISEVVGSDVIQPYVVVNGTIISPNPWEGSAGYDYASTEWYRNAVENPGKTVYTDVYADAVTGEDRVTLSTTIDDKGDVAAFDIRLDSLNQGRLDASVPDGGSYFLFDRKGDLLYCTSALDLDAPETQEYLENLIANIEADTDTDDSTNIAGTDGLNRNVYYSQMNNGWTSVVTIPTQSILQEGWDSTLLAMAGVFAIILVIAAVFMIRSSVEERKARHTSDTLKLLGDTFYAIYRVNYIDGTYEAIKSSPDVRNELGEDGRRGDYAHLIKTLKRFVDERTYAEFEKSFSLQNIRLLVDEGVTEFGGDFRRLFTEGYRWVSIRIVHKSDLRLNEVVMCFRDIDNEKQRELVRNELLENALDSAKRTVERKTAYFSEASHDMRTPLNAIIGLTELAKRDMDDASKISEYLNKIEGAGNQLLDLVNDVLDVSRLEHGDSGMVNYVPMSLSECVRTTLGLFSEQAKREGKVIDTVIDVADDHVYGDSKRINQILNNLVSNALKYSYEGASINVSLRETTRNGKTGQFQLDVADTGVGMSEEFLTRVFEPFARETMFAPTGVTGTGLGMPIVKSLVQQMSGEISVRSKLGEGSTFTIILPLQIVENEPVPDADEKADSPDPQDGKAKADFTGRKVLVAEDNDINMLISTEFLKTLGIDVVEARNGEEALMKFGNSAIGEIDVILMDMQMPVMDGCDAARAIRALEREDAATVPIIAVTANAFAEDIAKTTEAGMNGHLAKPFALEDLIDTLGKAWAD